MRDTTPVTTANKLDALRHSTPHFRRVLAMLAVDKILPGIKEWSHDDLLGV